MPRSRNIRLNLDPTAQSELKRLTQLPSIPAVVYRRARAILLLAAGMRYREVSRIADLDRANIFRWVKRYLAGGIASLRNPAQKNSTKNVAIHDRVREGARSEMSFAESLRALSARNAALARDGLLEQLQVREDFN